MFYILLLIITLIRLTSATELVESWCSWSPVSSVADALIISFLLSISSEVHFCHHFMWNHIMPFIIRVSPQFLLKDILFSRQISIFTGQRSKTRLEASQRVTHQRQSPGKSLKYSRNLHKPSRNLEKSLEKSNLSWDDQSPVTTKSAVSIDFLHILLQAYSTDFRSCTFSKGGLTQCCGKDLPLFFRYFLN